MADKSVFVVGPGYVGREIIDLLLVEGYTVSTLVRRKEAATELESDGIKTYLGDLNDRDLITKLASENSIVFHTATADHLSSAEAILAGIEKRAEQGLSTIYLHQSGTSVLSDGSSGTLNPKIYSDLEPDDLDALSEDAPHRKIDLAIVAMRKKLGDKAKIFIMMPPIIYGCNPKYNRLSIQIPTLTRFALKHGYSGHAGAGKAAWGVIHVKDMAKAYITILHWLETSPSEVGLEHPYFFCEDGETTWAEVAQLIANVLHEKGRIESAEIKSIPQEQYSDLFGDSTANVIGCNCRNRAERLRKLGWGANEKSLEQALKEEELSVLLAEKGFQKIKSGVGLIEDSGCPRRSQIVDAVLNGPPRSLGLHRN